MIQIHVLKIIVMDYPAGMNHWMAARFHAMLLFHHARFKVVWAGAASL
jgi:hypothetical protein